MLTHPRDLEAWQRWQASRSRLRRAAARVKLATEQPRAFLTTSGDRPRTLVVLDTLAPTSRKALLEPALQLHGDYALLTPTPYADPSGSRSSELALNVVPAALADVTRVVAAGHYLPLGAAAYVWSRRVGAEFVTVQHGLLTPHAPPLAPDSRLLAWSAADADFWASGREDVETAVVGSQLLWEAGATTAALTDDRPTFLGQLHSAEIGRVSMARFTFAFCRREQVRYRPHPGERDRLSRWQHALWRRRGIDVDDGTRPLGELGTPVVSVFSTGILEAAARGLPAWADFDRPPAWLSEFWERYGMARYGSDPTPAPIRGSAPPAETVAAFVEERR